MKRMLVGFVVLALLMVAAGSAGTKDVSTFDVFCTFDSGYVIIGDSTIIIDTVRGVVLTADLSLEDGFGNEVAYFQYPTKADTNAAGDVEIIVYGNIDTVGTRAWIVLTLPVKSLKKYAGGNVIASDSYWTDGSSSDNLASGRIELR